MAFVLTLEEEDVLFGYPGVLGSRCRDLHAISRPFSI
jgi:hypothetical protein